MQRAIPLHTFAVWTLRISLLVLGLFIFSVGLVMNVRANLGLGPWNVFHYGLSLVLPITLGQASQVVGIVVIAVSYVLGIKPGYATVANMFLVGVFIDLTMAIMPGAHEPVAQYTVLAASLLVMGFGTAMYIKAGLGAGPRDGLMLGLVLRSGWRVGVIRSLMEGTVLVLGYLMGGPVGIGTALFVVAIGPAVDLSFVLLRVPVQRKKRSFRNPLARGRGGQAADPAAARQRNTS